MCMGFGKVYGATAWEWFTARIGTGLDYFVVIVYGGIVYSLTGKGGPR